jgi:Ca-activated chloride channel family protein
MPVLAVTFLAANRLQLLVLVAALGVVYWVLQHRRRHAAVRFTNVRLLAAVAPKYPGWRRHVPAVAAALAISGLIFGLARPVVQKRVAKESAVVVLTVDVSASMNATDVSPTRIDAAKAAAKKFVHGLPAGFSVGLVSFDRTATVLSPPTTDHNSVVRAVDQLTTGPGTATGDAIYTALDVISAAGKAVANGKPAVIVLMSDGVPTVGRPVDDAANAAAAQHIPVTTIAFGTSDGTLNVQGQFVSVPADPDTMARIADITGGSFFQAVSAQELKKVYNSIGNRVGFKTIQKDVSMPVIAFGVILLMIACGAAMLWAPRML